MERTRERTPVTAARADAEGACPLSQVASVGARDRGSGPGGPRAPDDGVDEVVVEVDRLVDDEHEGERLPGEARRDHASVASFARAAAVEAKTSDGAENRGGEAPVTPAEEKARAVERRRAMFKVIDGGN